MLDGTRSKTFLSGATLTYAWKQTGGPAVTLDNPKSATPAFAAPSVSASTNFVFSLTVNDGTSSSAPDSVTVTVLPSQMLAARVNGAALTATFDSALDATSKPRSGAFTVTASKGGMDRTIGGASSLVSISGVKVTATLDAAVAADETLTVRYDRPASGAVLKYADATALPSVPDRPATNAGTTDTTRPTVSSATVNGTALKIVFSETLNPSAVPGRGRFTVRVAGSDKTPTGAALAGKTVTLALADAVTPGQTVQVTFTAGTVQDLSGNGVLAVNRRSVKNETPAPPALSTTTAPSVNGDTLTLTFDKTLDGSSVPAASAFTVNVGGSAADLAATGAVAVSGSTVTLTLAAAALRVQTVTVAYTKPSTGGKLQGADGLEVATFAAQAVTNATPADETGPRYVSATANGKTVTVTFDEALDANVPAAVRFQRSSGGVSAFSTGGLSVSGRTATATYSSAVGHGDAVVMRYALKSEVADRLKDLSGNDAPAFSGKTATNNTPPAFSSASVDGAALTITFDGGLDTASVPAADAFAVKVGGTAVDLADSDAVAVSGSTVTLALKAAVVRVQTVTVSYLQPPTTAGFVFLRDADGAKHPVAGFTDKAVTNATPADETRPAFASATVSGAKLTVTFDEALDESVTPFVAVMTVHVNGTRRLLTGTHLGVSGSTATATLGSAVTHGQTVLVSYSWGTQGGSPLRDLSGNDARSFSNEIATNTTPPAFSSASVDGDALTVTFNGGLDTASVPDADAFAVKVGGTAADLAETSPVAVSGSTATLTLAEPVLRIRTLTVSYAAPATGDKLQDADNGKNAVPNFTDKAVTNATPADETRPAFASATVSGAKLTVTFDEALDESVTPFVAVMTVHVNGTRRLLTGTHLGVSGSTATATLGSAVTHGQTVLVSYSWGTQGGSPLRDLSGNDARSFSNEIATNATPPAFSSASVDGDALTITFDGGLDTASVPAADAFAVKVGGAAVDLADASPVAVSGSTVALTLAAAAPSGVAVTASYAAPATGNKLQDADNAKNPVPDFADQAVTNNTVADGTAPTVSSATIDGATLTVTFNEGLHAASVPAASAFTVKVGGTAESLASTDPVAVGGSAVTLNLATPVNRNHAVTVGYTKPATGQKIRDRSGEEAESFADTDVTNRTGGAMAQISMAAIVSTPSIDADGDETAETYGRGGQIRVKVTWSADVAWDATAAGAELSVGLDIGGTARKAVLTGGASGTARALTFGYTVAADDSDTDGIVLTRTAANDLVALANGATLEDAQGRAASRQRGAFGPAAGHKVDGSQTGNNPPVYNGAGGTIEAFTKTLVSLGLAESEFSDPDGDALTFALSWSRDDVYVADETRWVKNQGRLYYKAKADCELEALTPKPASPFDNVATVTATDPDGATAEATLTYRTEYECVPAPTLESVAVDAPTGKILTLTFDKDLAAPTAGRQQRRQSFALDGFYHQGRPVRSMSPNSVAVDAKTVTLTVPHAAPRGREVTVSYDDYAEVLRGEDASVASFSGGATRAGSDAALLAAARVEGTTLALTFDRALDAGSRPAGGDFSVSHMSGGGAGGIRGTTDQAAVDGKRVTVTLASAWNAGDRAFVSYRPGATPLRDEVGGARVGVVVDFDAKGYSNAAPVYVSGFVAGSTVTLYYDEPLDTGSVPAGGAFTVGVSGSAVALAESAPVAVSDTAVSLTLSSAVTDASATVTVAYAVPGTNAIRDLAGNAAAGFTGAESKTVANRGQADPGAPELASTDPAVAAPKQAVLTLAFDQPLDPAAVPGNAAFAISHPWTRVESVAVRGERVELGLSAEMWPCTVAFTVSYEKPDADALRNVWGTEADGFSELAVTYGGTEKCTRDWPRGPALSGSIVLTAKRPFDTSEAPQAAWFTVSASGGAMTVTGAAFDPDDPHVLRLTLSREFDADETVTVSYRRPRGARGLWDADGNQLADLVDHPVLQGAAGPAVESVALTSDAGGDDTYALGERVRVTVTFDETVEVDTSGGTPRLTIDLDPADWGEKHAAYESGTGTTELVFAHEVVEPNTSTEGVAVLGNTLALGGGTIRSAATAADAELAHEGLGHDPAHKVDWRLAPGAASVTGVAVTSDAGGDDTYALGEKIRVTVTFGEAVEVDTSGGTPRLTIDLDPADWGAKHAAYESGTGTAELVFAHEVVEPNVSTEGIAVLGDTLALAGGTIRSTAAGVDADLEHDGLAHDPAHKVDWRLSPEGPSVPAFDDGDGATLAIDENHADGAEVGAVAATDEDGDALEYSLSGDDAASFEIGADGTISVRSGTTLDREARASYVFTAEVTDGEDADGNAEETPGIDDTIAVTVEVGNVEEPPGAPTGVTVEAASATALSVSWTAPAETGALAVAGYELRWFAGEADPADESEWTETGDVGAGASATVANLSAGTAYRVQARARGDGTGPWSGSGAGRTAAPEAPEATGVAIVSSPADGDTYALGETIRVAVTFDEAVDVDTAGGTPALTIDMDPADWGEKQAAYESGTGTQTLTFVHAVVEPNYSTQGVAVLANSLALGGGGTIRSKATGADADLAHGGLGHDPAHKVDWRPEAATVTGVEVSSRPASGDTYRYGEQIRVTVTFSEAVDVTGSPSPRLKIDMDPADWGEIWVAYESGRGTSALTFTRTVVDPNYSTEGIAVLADTLEAHGGAIRSAANGKDAELAHDGLDHDPNHKVDWRPGLSVADAKAKEGAGAAVEFAVSLSQAAIQTVTVDYATADGTARAGEDYTAASGTLTIAAGESSKTISVAVLDDAHDEGEETFTLRLSNAEGARLEDGEATGTIENTDLMPAALLARIGRATAEQVVEHIEERMAAPRQRGFRARFAGQEFQPGRERDFALGFLTQFTRPMGMGGGMSGSMGMGGMGGSMGMGGMTGMGGMAGSMGMGGMNSSLGAAGMSGMSGTRGLARVGMGGGTSGAMGMPGMGGMSDMGGMTGSMGMAGQQPMGYASAGDAHETGLFGTMLGHDPLSSSGFELSRESRGGILSVWSRSSRSHFSGMEDALSLDGDVRTTMVGADYSRGALTVGLSVGRTLGLGGYRGPSGGQMTTSMTGFYPWVGYQLSDRVSVWGVTGYGTGSLSLTPDGASALETGVSMAMSAVGTRSELAGSRATGGFSLALKADALWVGAASDLLDGAAGRLNASEAGVTRVRTALEGSRAFTLGGRLSLTPSVEVGLRRDGGDAETGAGMDVGGGLAFSDTVTGLSLDVRVRTLVVHQAEGFRERGMSLSLGWDPTPSTPLGLTARVTPSWGGQARGGAEALWGNQMAYGMGSHRMHGSGGQLDAEVGYGLAVGARFVGTPKVGTSTSMSGRDYRFGYGLAAVEQGSVSFELGIEGRHRVSPMQAGADTGFLGKATLGWGGGSGASAGGAAHGSLQAPDEPVAR